MVIGVVAAALISFWAGSVITVSEPKVEKFTKNAIEGGYHGESKTKKAH